MVIDKNTCEILLDLARRFLQTSITIFQGPHREVQMTQVGTRDIV